ncbi:MAG: cache domain-containing protein [Spirochaetes bacterium]|nr:cache domain-containing protein [Spirochaetota bacterium]
MKISKKFIIINILIASLIISICFLIFIIVDYYYQKQKILDELKKTNEIFISTVDVYFNLAIENHLKLISENNKIYIFKEIEDYKKGIIAEKKAKENIKNYLRNQKIGKTGYIFIWNIKDYPYKVILDLHPEIEGEDVSYVDFVKKGVELKNGYMEYLWANPSDPYPKYKSMYLNYIKEFDWIICVSSYKDEFYYLLDIDKFRNIILNIRNFGNGNSFIIDYSGNIIIHSFEKGNFLNAKDKKNKEMIKEIVRKKEGYIEYYWYDYKKDRIKQYKKLAYFSYSEKFKFIIVSTVFIKDAFSYYYKLLYIALFILFSFILLTAFITYNLTHLLLKPFYLLQKNILNILKLNNSKNNNEEKSIEKDFNFKEDEIVSFSKFFEKILIDLNEINLKLKIEYQKEKIFRQEYEDQKNLLFHLMNLLPSELITIDQTASIINYNDKFYNNLVQPRYKEKNANIYDYSFYQILDIYRDDDEKREGLINELISETNKNKNICKKQVRFLLENGEDRVYNITVIPFFEKSNIKYLIFKFDDITDELRKIKRDIEVQKIESISNLIRGLSHDINNYLGALIGGINLLKMDIEDDLSYIENTIKQYLKIIDFHKKRNFTKNRGADLNTNGKEVLNIRDDLNYIKYRLMDNYLQSISIISESVKKASNLISKLSLLTRKKEIDFKNININEIINRVVAIIKSSTGKNLEIEIFNPNNKEYFVSGIEEHLESVFINLLINSYHSMTIMYENGIRKDFEMYYNISDDLQRKCILRYNLIKITFEEVEIENKNYLKVTVKDNGIGIPEEIKERIFEPFFSTKTKDKGEGLGLYIIKQIIQNHGGFIDFKSKLYEGTEFYVYLPIINNINNKIENDITQFSSIDQVNLDVKLNKEINKQINEKKINIQNILIIDDDENIRYFLKKGLEKMGFHVKEAENGVKGIDLYLREKDFIDIIILDLIMPGLSGKDTFLELKKINKNVKVIMISGFTEDEKIKDCIENGVYGFISKPFEINVLIDKFKSID